MATTDLAHVEQTLRAQQGVAKTYAHAAQLQKQMLDFLSAVKQEELRQPSPDKAKLEYLEGMTHQTMVMFNEDLIRLTQVNIDQAFGVLMGAPTTSGLLPLTGSSDGVPEGFKFSYWRLFVEGKKYWDLPEVQAYTKTRSALWRAVNDPGDDDLL